MAPVLPCRGSSPERRRVAGGLLGPTFDHLFNALPPGAVLRGVRAAWVAGCKLQPELRRHAPCASGLGLSCSLPQLGALLPSLDTLAPESDLLAQRSRLPPLPADVSRPLLNAQPRAGGWDGCLLPDEPRPLLHLEALREQLVWCEPPS